MNPALQRSTGHEACSHRSYFMTCDEFEALLARADGRCELCKIPAAESGRGKLVIDHDGRISQRAVRGLICSKCNSHLRHVDSGAREPDARTRAYLAIAGLDELGRALTAGRRRSFVAHKTRKSRPIEQALADLRGSIRDIAHREGVVGDGGSPDGSATVRMLVIYAIRNMPEGWRP